ncbi:hypothetical protein C8R46DRAFT_1081059 [Mycena filopes]|nr:hypothetical protein C8R46DRAFT_1081059 [Mycena filopes]
MTFVNTTSLASTALLFSLLLSSFYMVDYAVLWGVPVLQDAFALHEQLGTFMRFANPLLIALFSVALAGFLAQFDVLSSAALTFVLASHVFNTAPNLDTLFATKHPWDARADALRTVSAANVMNLGIVGLVLTLHGGRALVKKYRG